MRWEEQIFRENEFRPIERGRSGGFHDLVTRVCCLVDIELVGARLGASGAASAERALPSTHHQCAEALDTKRR